MVTPGGDEGEGHRGRGSVRQRRGVGWRAWWLGLAAGTWRRAGWAAPGLVLVPTVGLGFFNDDFVGLEKLLSIPPWALGSYLQLENFEFFRPLGVITFRWLLAVSGANPFWLHAIHLAVFFLAAWLAGVLLGRLVGSQARWWGAALALAYPGRVEAAAWLASLFDLYALVLVTWALVVAVGPWRRPWLNAALMACLGGLAVLYKESALILPGVVAVWQLLGVFPVASPGTTALRLAAPSVGVAVAFAARFPFLGGVGGYEGVGVSQLVANLLRLPELLGRMAGWPVHPDYGWSWPLNLVTAAALLALTAEAVRRRLFPGRVVAAGVGLLLLGVAPALAYLDPARVTYLQSRYLTVAALGVVLAATSLCVLRPLPWGVALLAVWTAGTATNLLPWHESAQRREALLAAVELATRGEGRHLLWVGGELDTWRGAQQLGGRVPMAVRWAFPEREIRVMSEFDQHLRGEPPCPPPAREGEQRHLIWLASTRPWLRQGLPPGYPCGE